MKQKTSAEELFDRSYNCAQSVLLAWAERHGIDGNPLVLAAGGFGAGMGRLQGTCGAVTGGIMAMGLIFADDDPENRDAKDECYRRVLEFSRRFEESFGTTLCRELIGCDLLTDEGKAHFTAERLASRVCRECVAWADRTITQIEAEQ